MCIAIPHIFKGERAGREPLPLGELSGWREENGPRKLPSAISLGSLSGDVHLEEKAL